MLDRWFGGDENSTDDDVDEYALIRTRPDQSKVRSYDEPVQPAHVRLEEPDVLDGEYQLQAISNGQFGKIVWKETFGDLDEGGDDATARLEEELRRLRREVRDQGDDGERAAAPRPAPGFDDPSARLAHEIVQAAVQSEEVMAAEGERILSRALDTAFSSGSPSVDYQIDGELQAAVHELRTNPERAQQYVSLASELTESLGESLGEGMRRGVAGGATDGGDAGDGGDRGGLADQLAAAADDSSARAPAETDAEVDTGASSLDGLEAEESDGSTDGLALDGLDLDLGTIERRTAPTADGAEPEYPDPETAADDTLDDPSVDDDGTEATTERQHTPGLAHPETPSELREMGWNDLQKLASEEGVNPAEHDGRDALVAALDAVLFGDDADDGPAVTGPESPPEPSAEEEIEYEIDTSASAPDNPDPDEIAREL